MSFLESSNSLFTGFFSVCYSEGYKAIRRICTSHIFISLMLVITPTVFPLPGLVTLWHHNPIHAPSHMAHELHWGATGRKMKAFWLKMYNSTCFGNIPPSLEFHYTASPSGGVLYPIAVRLCRGLIGQTLSCPFWMLSAPPPVFLCLIHTRVSLEFLPPHNPFQLLLPLSSLPMTARFHIGINYLHILTAHALFKLLPFGFLRNRLSSWIWHWLLILFFFSVSIHIPQINFLNPVTLLKIQIHLLLPEFKTLQHLPSPSCCIRQV